MGLGLAECLRTFWNLLQNLVHKYFKGEDLGLSLDFLKQFLTH